MNQPGPQARFSPSPFIVFCTPVIRNTTSPPPTPTIHHALRLSQYQLGLCGLHPPQQRGKDVHDVRPPPAKRLPPAHAPPRATATTTMTTMTTRGGVRRGRSWRMPPRRQCGHMPASLPSRGAPAGRHSTQTSISVFVMRGWVSRRVMAVGGQAPSGEAAPYHRAHAPGEPQLCALGPRVFRARARRR